MDRRAEPKPGTKPTATVTAAVSLRDSSRALSIRASGAGIGVGPTSCSRLRRHAWTSVVSV